MMTVIFRQYPAQGARYSAERCQEEGWFDESGWDTPSWFPDAAGNPEGRSINVGAGQPWSLVAWQRAAELWRRHGENNHLLFKNPQEEAEIQKLANDFRKKYRLVEGAPVPRLSPEAREDSLTREQLEAYEHMRDLHMFNGVSNYLHHFHYSQVESKRETVRARKLFDEAEMWRLRGSPTRALAAYENAEALPAMRKVLLADKDYRRDIYTQEQMLELQWRYLDLVDELNPALKAQRAQLPLAGVPVPGAGAFPVSFVAWLAPVIRSGGNSHVFAPAPFAGTDNEKVPLITQQTVETVMLRRNSLAPKPPAGAGGSPQQQPGGAPGSGRPPRPGAGPAGGPGQ
jgi:hypothetical protein